MKPGRRLLRPGCSGPDVKTLQHRLGVRVDGQFGDRTSQAVRAWKHHHGNRHPGPVVTPDVWRRLGVPTHWWPVGRVKGLTPGQVVSRVVLESQGLGFPHMTLQYVREANARHGPTVNGTRSDHQGPPSWAWAADISNGSHPTKQMDEMARHIAHWFHFDWNGSGIATFYTGGGLRGQMLYRTNIGGNHFNHVHLGFRRN